MLYLKDENIVGHIPPLNGQAVKLLEDALGKSPSKSIRLEINNAIINFLKPVTGFNFLY